MAQTITCDQCHRTQPTRPALNALPWFTVTRGADDTRDFCSVRCVVAYYAAIQAPPLTPVSTSLTVYVDGSSVPALVRERKPNGTD